MFHKFLSRDGAEGGLWFGGEELLQYAVKKTLEDLAPKDAALRPQTASDLLRMAAHAGREDRVRELLETECEIDGQGAHDWTPLLHAVAENHPNIVKLLLQKGANPDVANLLGITPLHYAAFYGRVGIAKTLIDFGVKLNLQDKNGDTALAIAAREQKPKSLSENVFLT